ncbi:hypothetical protein AF72_02000 [Xylella taiwanensis]|uniref:Uncharacterized protein n=1 Tax=Xylella taiwanensis TaxID=1444770 RepID=Z9JM83_9GAMM|nr:hypothetical protein AB672_09380 [Xylella taiwanensis]EWS79063.1 hypothetical protein AF72_02000 [Xylella taiwanensis]
MPHWSPHPKRLRAFCYLAKRSLINPAHQHPYQREPILCNKCNNEVPDSTLDLSHLLDIYTAAVTHSPTWHSQFH